MDEVDKAMDEVRKFELGQYYYEIEQAIKKFEEACWTSVPKSKRPMKIEVW